MEVFHQYLQCQGLRHPWCLWAHCRLQSASFTNLRPNRLGTTWKRQGAASSKEMPSPTTNLIQVWNHGLMITTSCLEGTRLFKFYHCPHPTGRTDEPFPSQAQEYPKNVKLEMPRPPHFRDQHTMALFACLMSRTISVNEQCFSLTTNQRHFFSNTLQELITSGYDFSFRSVICWHLEMMNWFFWVSAYLVLFQEQTVSLQKMSRTLISKKNVPL